MKNKNERIAVIDGLRTPFIKAGTDIKELGADDLGTIALKELLKRMPIKNDEIDEVIIGNVAQPAHAANISRVIALNAGLKQEIPAFTVHRNCASGMESVSSAAYKLFADECQFIIAGGTESMSNIPFLFSDKMKQIFEELMKAKTPLKKIQKLLSIRLKYLKPELAVVKGLTDPTCNLIMGLTAENIVNQFKITRIEQDEYALKSHQKAINNISKLNEEIIPIIHPHLNKIISRDNGPIENQSIEKLQKLKPYFDRKYGTITVGNACPLTDGAAMLLLCKESTAKNRKLPVLGYINQFTYAGLDPKRMGLGPVFATNKLLIKTGLKIKDFDLIEMNEAFAAQIIGNLKAFESKKFANEELNQTDAIGQIDINKLNVNGGAIALGHPVGTSGTRILLTALKELKRQKKQLALANLCVGGGQGAAFILESE